METTVAQNLTTIAVFALAFMLTYIALSALRYERYGREALLAAAAFIGVQAIVRTLSINAVVTADTARLLVGMSALTAFAIIVQIAVLKTKDNRYKKGTP